MFSALIVDEILGQQEIIVKDLSSELMQRPGYQGGTFFSDGVPGLVISIRDISKQLGKTI